MSPLERLGLEVAAYQLLGSRTKAAVLRALIEARGVSLPPEAIARARPWKEELDAESSRNVVKTRICLLRETMEDVGLGGLIITHSGCRYALPEPGRSDVIARLMEEAA